MSAFLNLDGEESPTSANTSSPLPFFTQEFPSPAIKKRKRSLNTIQVPSSVIEGVDKEKPVEKKRKTSISSKQKPKLDIKSTLINELDHLQTMHQFHSESIDLDTLETPNELSIGKILVMSSFPSNPLKFVFRISSRTEYENVLNTRKDLEDSEKEWKNDFESSGCGLEEVEIIDYGECKKSVDAVKQFAKEIGVGLTGNRAQISDIVKFALDLV